MTKEQFSKAERLKTEEQLLDNVFYSVSQDNYFQRLSETYRKRICEAFNQIKTTIHTEFEKL